jgi:ferredoxin-NADP reductase
LKIGATANFEGPIGKLRYHGRGKFTHISKQEPFLGKTKICLLTGGTGITPCLSIAQASLLAGEGYDIKLLNFNKT